MLKEILPLWGTTLLRRGGEYSPRYAKIMHYFHFLLLCIIAKDRLDRPNDFLPTESFILIFIIIDKRFMYQNDSLKII